MQIPAFTSAVTGMADASRRYNAVAEQVATGTADLPSALVKGTVLAPIAYALNATVVRTTDETLGTLIDVMA